MPLVVDQRPRSWGRRRRSTRGRPACGSAPSRRGCRGIRPVRLHAICAHEGNEVAAAFATAIPSSAERVHLVPERLRAVDERPRATSARASEAGSGSRAPSRSTRGRGCGVGRSARSRRALIARADRRNERAPETAPRGFARAPPRAARRTRCRLSYRPASPSRCRAGPASPWRSDRRHRARGQADGFDTHSLAAFVTTIVERAGQGDQQSQRMTRSGVSTSSSEPSARSKCCAAASNAQLAARTVAGAAAKSTAFCGSPASAPSPKWYASSSRCASRLPP